MQTHDDQLDELIESAIQRALDILTPHGAATISRAHLEHHLRIVAQEAATVATDMSRLDLVAGDMAAEELGITRQRVWKLARSRGLGWQVEKAWIFTPAEVDAMRDRVPGRPPSRRLVSEVHRESLPEIRAALSAPAGTWALGTTPEEVAAMSDAEVLKKFMIFDDDEGHREVITREE
jgi:hypothetical protein